jgi:hypothetical protein
MFISSARMNCKHNPELARKFYRDTMLLFLICAIIGSIVLWCLCRKFIASK